MKALQGLFGYILSFIGAFSLCLCIITIFGLFSGRNADEIKFGIWFIGTITLFYVFIGSLFWEMAFWLIPFKTWWTGGIFYLLFGAVYGGVTITIVTFTLGETAFWGWVIGINMIALASFVFYVIRKKVHF